LVDANEVRDQQRASWERFSGGWDRWDHLVLPMLEPVGTEIIRMLEPGRSAEVLDVAAGTGEPGLSIAAIASEGRVVVTDLSAAMLDIARRNAESRELINVDFRECSADDLPFEEKSFDAVSCRFGFMFFPDPGVAASELWRVLRPGGRVAASVWAGPDGNPWATIPMAAIAAEVEMPAPSPDTPGLFRFAEPGSLESVLGSAGMTELTGTDVRSEVAVDSAEEYWEYMTDVAAPIVAGLERADADARERIRAKVLERVREFRGDGGLRIPMHARCVVATR
jgi:ubiquinone/menaquinone biosynthesis C-methylase UbiE